jgi:hypothetical protein
MAMASVILLILFVTEVQAPDQPIATHAELPQHTAGIILHSADLRHDFQTREKRRSLLIECSKKLNKIDLDCIKEKMKNLPF